MEFHRLASVFTGLRLGLHTLVALIVLIVVLRAIPPVDARAWLGLCAVLVWALLYAGGVAEGAWRARAHRSSASLPDDASVASGASLPLVVRHRAARVWWGLGTLTVVWAVAAWCLPEAAYLVFPLFFIQLHVAGSRAGTVLLGLSTVMAIVALGVQQGFSIPAAVGPVLGAAVALLIAMGYRSFAVQAQAREALLAELMRTQDELAVSERRAGEEAERTRLAGDIHDTVSQSLSSIQMLLHAAQRAQTPEETSRLMGVAQQTAAAAQAETRAIVRALTPAPLTDAGLGGALRRLAATDWSGGAQIALDVADDSGLDMSRRTALLRLAQGAVGNALQHAHAERIGVVFAWDHDVACLEVNDDGQGFDPERAPGAAHDAGHFGLASMRERVAQFGGELRVESVPAQGTRVLVRLPAPNPKDGKSS